MKQYVSYLRVSTGKQERSGLGLEAQRTIINHYVKGTIIKEYVESESAKTIKERPVLLEAIEFCKTSNMLLIVAKLDRLSRDVEDTFSLIKSLKNKVVICDIPFEPIDSFTLAIFAGMAQRERELISIRTKQALQELKKRGVKLGSPQNLIGNLKGVEASLQKIVDFYNKRPLVAIIEKYRREGYTLAEIAIILNEEGFRTFRGHKYTKVGVCRLLKCIEKYVS